MRCLNWKVIAAVAAIGIVVYALAPAAVAAAVPLLIVAACPLSMLLMMRAMGSRSGGTPERDGGEGDRTERADAPGDELRGRR